MKHYTLFTLICLFLSPSFSEAKLKDCDIYLIDNSQNGSWFSQINEDEETVVKAFKTKGLTVRRHQNNVPDDTLVAQYMENINAGKSYNEYRDIAIQVYLKSGRELVLLHEDSREFGYNYLTGFLSGGLNHQLNKIIQQLLSNIPRCGDFFEKSLNVN